MSSVNPPEKAGTFKKQSLYYNMHTFLLLPLLRGIVVYDINIEEFVIHLLVSVEN